MLYYNHQGVELGRCSLFLTSALSLATPLVWKSSKRICHCLNSVEVARSVHVNHGGKGFILKLQFKNSKPEEPVEVFPGQLHYNVWAISMFEPFFFKYLGQSLIDFLKKHLLIMQIILFQNFFNY